MIALIPYASTIYDLATKYGVNTIRRMAHFLGQMHHESAGFTRRVENLNYDKDGLLKQFSKYFNSATATIYANKPEKIGNKVYANRMGNGNEASGDGYKYRGRGYIQLTGKENYQKFKVYSGIDVVNYPEKASEVITALKIAFWYWHTKGLNKYADANDITSITQKINGGKNGLADRTKWTNYYLKADLSDFLKKKIMQRFFWL